MKNILIALILVIIYSSVNLRSQSLKETLLYESKDDEFVQVYNYFSDVSTGSYCYIVTNPDNFKYLIKSRYKDSKYYDFISGYYIKFDSKGNYYCIAANYIDGGYDSSAYFLIINGDEVAQVEYAEGYDAYINPDDEYEVVIRENGEYKIMTVSTTSPISYSAGFDKIIPSWRYIPENAEGEQDYFFRDENGDRYYIVRKGGKAGFLHGSFFDETPYSDIDNSSITYDRNNRLTYIANRGGNFYEEGGEEFVVQGDKEYSPFVKVFNPVLLNDKNEPVYSAAISQKGIDSYVYSLVIGNEQIQAYTNSEKTQKVEEITNGIYDLKIDDDGTISYMASIRINWNDFDFESVYSKNAIIVDGVSQGFYNDLGTIIRNDRNGDLLFTYNPTNVSGKSVLNLKSNGVDEIISDPKFSYLMDYGFSPDGKIYYIGVISGDYEAGIKDRYTIVIDGIEVANEESFVMSEVDSLKYSYVNFGPDGKYAYATYEFIDTASDFNNWYSISFMKTNEETLSPPILNFPGRAFFNSIQLFRFLNDGRVFFIGQSDDMSNPSLSYIQLNVNEQADQHIYNSISDVKYNRLMNQFEFRATRENKIFEVVFTP